MNKLRITITVDTNDADYNTKVSDITEAELDELRPLIQAIKDFKGYHAKSDGGFEYHHDHNYPLGEYSPRTDLGEKTVEELYPDILPEIHEIFQELLPYGEHGLHSIESITVTPATEIVKLL